MERHLQKVGFILIFQLLFSFNVFCQLLPPSDIVATSISATQINLTWTASADATAYDIERSSTGAEPWDVIQGDVVETNYEDAGLASGVEYFYRIKAKNSSFQSDYSLIASATTMLNPVVATAATDVTTNSFEANWTMVSDATSYKIDVSTASDFSSFVTGYQSLIVNNSPFLITGLDPNQVYYYRVVVTNAGGDSEFSNIISVSTIPTSPLATAATAVTGIGFTANWNAVEVIIDYRLDVSRDENFTDILQNYDNLTVPGTSQEITGLTSGETYYYRVRAVGDGGTSGNSNVISVTTDELLPPATPNATAATNISQTTFTANWSSVSGATSYRLDVSTNQNFNNPLDGYDNLTVTGTSQEITGLTSGETYYYRVRAVGDGGTSGNSNVVSVTTDELPPPAAPNATVATNISQTTFTANWSVVSGATSYRLDVSTNQNLNNPLEGYDNLTVTGISQEITGLTSGETYYYRVRAVGDGGTSGNSNVISVTTDELPLPAAPNATVATNISQTTFTANWSDVSDATSYRLDVSINQNLNNPLEGYDNLTVTGTSQEITGLTSGETYYYRVRAVGDGGTSGNSNVVSVTTDELPPPAAPNATVATNISQTTFTANWSVVSGATSYRLDVSTNQNLNNPLEGYDNLTVTGTSQEITGLTSGETYYYRVRAVGDGGTSGNSNVISATTDELPPPVAPNATVATNISQTTFTANWSGVSGATSYRLDVSTNQNLNNPLEGYDNLTVTGTSQEITGLTSGETYYYRVRAVGDGGTSGNSNVISVTTDELLPPATPNATPATNISQTTFTANWSVVSGATSYRLDVSTNQNFNNPLDGYDNLTVTGTSQEITGLTSGETYYYRVRAVGDGGTSGNSNVISVTTDELPLPAAPNATVATNISQTTFTANWSVVSGATSYRLDVSINQNFNNILEDYDNLTVSGTSRQVTGLSAGTTYYYRVRSFGNSGTSGNSNVQNATTLQVTPPTASAPSDITTNSFVANWSNVNNSDEYQIDVSTSNNFSSFIEGYNSLEVTGTSVQVTGLSSSTTYYYRIRTIIDGELSANSNVVNATTSSIPAPTATAATSITPGSFVANWSAVAGAIGYLLDVSTSTTFATFVSGYNALAVQGTSQTVTGLASNTNYRYRVRTVSSSETSGNSNVISVNTDSPLPPASPVVNAATNITSNSFTANWEPVLLALSYEVEVSTDADFNNLVDGYDPAVTPLVTFLNVTGLEKNKNYYYRVRALDLLSESENSDVIVARTQDEIPAPPSELTATAVSSSQINLQWTDNADNETSYVIQSSTSENGDFTTLEETEEDVTTYSHTGLAQGTTRYYRIIARNDLGNSSPSNVASAQTQNDVPAVPTYLTATAASSSQINLTWTDNATNETGYVVQSSTAQAGPFTDLVTLGAGVTSHSHTGLSENTRVYYRVIARNGDVDSDPSNIANAVTNFSTPAAPTNLAATAASSSQINLTWTDNATNETGYVVQSSTAEAGPFADLIVLDAGATSHSHTGLSENTRVYYRVIARNGDVDSDPSNIANAVTNFSTPAAPTNLTATAASSSQINLTWTDNATNETGYVVQSSTAEAGPFADLIVLDAGATSHSHTGLSENTRVYYRVIARNGDVDSDPSNIANAVTNFSTPAAPTNLTATAASSSQINLTWTDNATNETGYIVQSSTAEAGPFADLIVLGAGVTSHSHTGLAANTTVYYRVIARNEAVNSDPSNVASAVTNGNVPTVPTNFSAIAFGNQINLSWTNNTDETGYVLERRISSVAEYAVLATLPQDVTTYSDINLPEGTTYYYRLKAVNLSGESGYTEERIATTLITVPTKPLGITANAVSTSQIDVVWNDNLNEVTYVLEQSNALNGSYTVLATQVKDDTTFSHINLYEGATVFYRVKAVNPAGESVYSDVVSATTFVNVPQKPVGIAAAANSGSEIMVSWTDNSNESNYVLESSNAADGIFAVLASPAKDATSFVHTGLSEGTTVFYRLRAVNIAGSSEYSDVVRATTIVTPPTAPATLSATEIGETQFTANWTASVNASGYKLDVSSDSFTTYVTGFKALDVIGTTQLVTGLTPNTLYKFRVRAINAGGESANSSELAVTTIALPPVANPVTVFSNNQFVASWSAIPNVLEYRIDVSTTSDFASFVTNYQNTAIAGTSATVTGLAPATAYYFRVRVVNAGGASLNSNVVSLATLPNAPIAPVATIATDVTQTSFMSHWNPVTGATSYELDVSTNNFVTTLPGYTSKVITNTFETVTGLSANTQYQYRVRAVNIGGKSANSNYISIKTLNYPPNAPVAAAPTSISKNGFTARWSRVPNVLGYRFDLSLDNFATFINGYRDRIITAKDTSLVIAGLNPETNYQYRVRAINDGGPSANSNQISVATLPNVPGQPHALPATNVTQTGFTVNWESVAGSSGYKLDISTNGFETFVPGYNSKTVSGTREAVTGLAPNVAYQYRIRAVNPGGESVNSNVIDVNTLPNVPVVPTAYQPSMLSQTGFTAHWSIVPGATSYQFDLSNDNFQTFIPGYNSLQVNDTSLVVTNLAANSSYQYRVRAINAGGVSDNSNVINANTLPFPPDAPRALDATVIRKIGFTANWTSVPGATTYYLDVSDDNFQTLLEDYENKPVTDTFFNVTGLLVNTNYQYRVRAGNIAGVSPNSNTISISTLPNITGSPIVTNSETNEDTQTPPDLTVKRALPEDPDITHFKVFNIQNGTLYTNDGLFEIEEGGFITVAEGMAGLRFTPALNVTLSGSYEVQASTSPSDAGLVGEVATATISIIPINDPPLLSNIETEILQFSQGDNTTIITETLTLIDIDDEILDSAVVQFQSGYQQGHDFLYFPNNTKIRVKQYDGTTGTLLLIGQATALEYEEAFRSVLFYNDIIGFTDVGLKVVSFKIWDGKAYSEVKTRKIQITDVFVELEIPNGITPNQDGVNDAWTIENIELYPDCFIEIYGRNGERLFQSNGYKEKWNGTYNGQPLQVGTYYYFIDLREKGKKYKGAVAILR